MWKKLSTKVVERMRVMAGQPKLDRGGMDTYRAALLLKCHDWHQQPGRIGTGVQPAATDVAMFYAEAEALDTEDLKEYAAAQLDKQILHMFSQVQAYYSAASAAADAEATSSSRSGKDDGGGQRPKHLHKSYREGKEPAANAASAASPSASVLPLMQKVGFWLECKPSKCNSSDSDNGIDSGGGGGGEGAGQGVFLRCAPGVTVPPGTLLALFPGLVHLPEYTTKTNYVQENLLPDPHFMLMARLDNTVIDARTAAQCPANPFALGHMVNHVPKGGMPNVQQYPYDFPADPLGYTAFPKDLRPFIPNSYFKAPTFLGTHDRSAMMRGAVLLAAR